MFLPQPTFAFCQTVHFSAACLELRTIFFSFFSSLPTSFNFLSHLFLFIIVLQQHQFRHQLVQDLWDRSRTKIVMNTVSFTKVFYWRKSVGFFCRIVCLIIDGLAKFHACMNMGLSVFQYIIRKCFLASISDTCVPKVLVCKLNGKPTVSI